MTAPTLHRSLTSGQLAMIAIGGAIGTGLFLGSGFAIGMAGPAVLVSYAIAGLITLALMGALAEMTVAAPVAGSFGAHAEMYLGPLAGYLVRYAYWSAVVLAVGTEVTAVAVYMAWWLPAVPGIVWIAGFTAALIAVNLASVGWFGAIEYGFSAIKVAAIIVFLLLGGAILLTSGNFDNFHAAGGFAPFGAWGVWKAVIVAVFSYLSVEMIAIAAAEAADPERAIVRAFRATFVRLAIFYLGSLAIMLALVPWPQAGTATSPFVTVMAATGIPYAAGVINAVVLVAALSAMNSQLYAASRMLWGLAEAGQAPRALARLAANGAPRRAVLASSGGAALAAVVNAFAPAGAFAAMLAVTIAVALFTWMMIFVTHLAFRRRHGAPAGFRMPGHPWPSLFGAAALAGLLVTTPFTAEFRWTLAWGGPFLLLMTAIYFLRLRRRAVGLG